MKEDYLQSLQNYLDSLNPINLEKITIKDDDIPIGAEGIIDENAECDLKEGDSIEVTTGHTVGYEPSRVISVKAKVVEDKRTPGKKEATYVYNKIKKCIIRRI